MSRAATDHVSEENSGGMLRLKLTIAYDGSGYAGWQVQKTGTGVQEKVESALAKLFPSRPRLHSSSRTDAGVHALGLVAHFDVPKSEMRMPVKKLVLAVNAWLPDDIRVLSAHRCQSSFHARFSAAGKQYRYYIWNHPAMNPLLRHTAWHVPRPLDVAAMRAGARQFVGRHDFRALSSNPGYNRRSTVRRVRRCEVQKRGRLLTVIVEADGFLYKMCRGIVGMLVQIGLGRFAPSDVSRILAGRDRRLAGMTAPAHGLVLWRVTYPKSRNTVQSQGIAVTGDENDAAIE
ncbi:MAG: tRNA pseudouridine(38-40) synthase TruA [Verrucomicrobiota bacterium]|nr:tRNA pseudouridine(38-40) synthase TruA [Verrucomicrobiota bacterium]